jgi:hypothetical protein
MWPPRIDALQNNDPAARRLSNDLRGRHAASGCLAEHRTPRFWRTCADTPPCPSGMGHRTCDRHGRAVRQTVGGRCAANRMKVLHETCFAGHGIVPLCE